MLFAFVYVTVIFHGMYEQANTSQQAKNVVRWDLKCIPEMFLLGLETSGFSTNMFENALIYFVITEKGA